MRRANITSWEQLNRDLQNIYNILDTLSPVNPKAKNASIIQTAKGVDAAQNISEEGTPNFSKIGAGTPPAADQSFTVKDKTSIGTRTTSTNWRKGDGWTIKYEDGEYTQYIDNLVIKGWLKAKEFIIEQTKIRDANYLFTNGAVVKLSNGSTWFDVEDPNENGTAPFEVNDIIECLQVNITGATYTGGEIDDNDYLIKRLIYRVSAVSGLRVTVTTAAGAPTNKGKIKKGDVFARIANTSVAGRQGLVGIFNDEENAPYFDIRTSLSSYTAYKSNTNLKSRIGKLDGITDASFADLTGAQANWFGQYLVGNTYIKGNAFIEGSITLTNPSDVASSLSTYLVATYTTGDSFPVSPKEGDWHFYTKDPPDAPYLTNTWYKYTSTVWTQLGLKGTYITSTGVYTGELACNQLIAGSGIINSLSVLSTLTMGSAGTDGYIQSYGWNGTANGFQIKGGATPSVNLIGGTITGGTIQTSPSGSRIVLNDGSYTDKIAIYYSSGLGGTIYAPSLGSVEITGNVYIGHGFFPIELNAGVSNQFIVNDGGQITKVNSQLASARTGYFLRSDGTSYTPTLLIAGDLPTHSHSAANITSGTLDISIGGTGTGTQTANRVAVVNSVGSAIESSAITTTKLGYLTDVSSNIQAQFTGKMDVGTHSNTLSWTTADGDYQIVISNGKVTSSTFTP